VIGIVTLVRGIVKGIKCSFPFVSVSFFGDEGRDDNPFRSLMMHTNLSGERVDREKLKDLTLFRFI